MISIELPGRTRCHCGRGRAHGPLMIDMQRDFLEPGGFGESLGNDVSRLRAAVEPCRQMLATARRLGMLVIHTREGHRPDLSDAPRAKVERGAENLRIGSPGPMGRVLVRGEPGHEIIADLAPEADEPVIDKPGKGAFYQTDLDLMLRNRGISTCSSAASRPRSACTPPCARRTTAAIAASCPGIAAPPTFRTSTRPA